MDDAVFKTLRILGVLFCLPFAVRAADLTYVTPAQVDELQTTFAAASLTPDDLQTLIGTKGWRCDLYGVRTRLQVRRDIDVYRFTRTIPDAEIKNSGAQPITSYAIDAKSLRGTGEHGLIDEVRVTPKKELIAKLSIPERGVTVAYTLCRGS